MNTCRESFPSTAAHNPEDRVMTDSFPSGLPASRPPVDLRLDRPTPARMYDHLLGGKDNFAVDREAAERVKHAIPNTYEIVWENRFFLQRAVRYLAEAGSDQYLDLGTGLPTQGNVHEIAREIIPDARVVYVDNDPTTPCCAHAGQRHTQGVTTAGDPPPTTGLALARARQDQTRRA